MKTRVAHLTVLAGFALAQPLYDILRRNGEFFVAHRTTPGDILLLVLWLSAAVPCLLGLLLWLVSRASARAATALMTILVGAFVTMIALPAVAHRSSIGVVQAFLAGAVPGVVAAVSYWRFRLARQFLTLLSPAGVIFPLVFLLHPAMRPFVHLTDPTLRSGAEISGDTPVVFLIFDQLPLSSLLDPTGSIDARRFPGFAALAGDSIWFRNATTNADFTAWAVPALLSGKFPHSTRLPIAADYPHNLFTTLGMHYRIEAMEPVTHLCPERLCAEVAEPRWVRQLSMLSDLSVIYGRMVLPTTLAARLPQLTSDWRDFAHGQAWHDRWLAARDQDRRVPIGQFIDGIRAEDPQPTLYFAHVLLPHEPYIYLPDGRQFSAPVDVIGLDAGGGWPDDPWYALHAYRRHLLQVGYVDSLVSELIARLKREGLYDRALIVVSSDHGVSFTPGHLMKTLRSATAGELAAVPLLIKPAHHTGPEVSDRNVQSIDVLATVADLLHTQLPFVTAGLSAFGATPGPPDKTVYYIGATQTMRLPASIWDRVIDAARRNARLLSTGGPPDVWAPETAPFHQLLNHRISDFVLGDSSLFNVELMEPWRFSRVNPTSDFVPAHVFGRIRGSSASAAVPLAVAVNGVIRSTTKSVAAPLPTAGAWAALVEPHAFRDGMNVVDVYEIATDDGQPLLRPAWHSSGRPAHLNLILEEAAGWTVGQQGLYPREPLGDQVFRWTNGEAQVTLLREDYRDGILRVALAPITRPETKLTITVNDCSLFEGTLTGGAWERSFPLGGCRAEILKSPEVHIRLASTRFQPSAADDRVLGVPLLTLEFDTR